MVVHLSDKHGADHAVNSFTAAGSSSADRQLKARPDAEHRLEFKLEIGRRFAAALLPRLFGKNPRSHHKGATDRVRTGDQRLPILCHCQVQCQLGQDNN